MKVLNAQRLPRLFVTVTGGGIKVVLIQPLFHSLKHAITFCSVSVLTVKELIAENNFLYYSVSFETHFHRSRH